MKQSLALLVAMAPLQAQGRPQDYQRAERFLPWNVTNLAPPFSVAPVWHDSGSRFHYRADTAGGRHFLMVDPERRSQRPAFDHLALARALSDASGTRYEPLGLPFDRFTFVDAEPRSNSTCPKERTGVNSSRRCAPR